MSNNVYSPEVIEQINEAKKQYEQAKKAGKRASLLSKTRGNTFSTSLANIGPEEEINTSYDWNSA